MRTARYSRISMNIKSMVLTMVIINVIVFLFTQILNISVPAKLLSLTGKSGEILAVIFRRYGPENPVKYSPLFSGGTACLSLCFRYSPH